LPHFEQLFLFFSFILLSKSLNCLQFF